MTTVFTPRAYVLSGGTLLRLTRTPKGRWDESGRPVLNRGNSNTVVEGTVVEGSDLQGSVTRRGPGSPETLGFGSGSERVVGSYGDHSSVSTEVSASPEPRVVISSTV